MAVGAAVRQLFGPYEHQVGDLYRGMFVDLAAQIGAVHRWAPDATNILEIGCGEGAVCDRLAVDFPRAQITGIDITPRIGRLFRGDRARVQFEQIDAAALAQRQPAQFDLILICDVLHHVPWDQHRALLREAHTLLRPGGVLVIKDWERILNLGHLACVFSDRVLTGDRVKFGTVTYFRALLDAAFGPGAVVDEARVRPWPNNLLLFVRPTRSAS
jgi:2-polyprenyl-6-hydroxyphenyl methylase/3-demethylubiquinone-9 3-methyltransferase